MLTFIIPGPINQVTGGYVFDKKLVETLRKSGLVINIVELDGKFPIVDETARTSACAALNLLPDKSLVVIDGLALPAFDHALAMNRHRLGVIGFVHHPLAYETGITTAERNLLEECEIRIWQMLKGMICPSKVVADAVASFGIDRSMIKVAPPGIETSLRMADKYANERDRNAPTASGVRLLIVGSLIPRKGHILLIEALSELKNLNWKLDCLGSTQRSPETTDRVRILIGQKGLKDLVHLHGEVSDSTRDRAYINSQIFVLPSFYEGYGMVLAEAMSWGLPIISTTGGAIPDTVPPEAGLLVAPNDQKALVKALEELIVDQELRSRMSWAARNAAQALPDWPTASRTWINAVEDFAN
jgi:glycosyltransferase involved in cell wall biosynthesis